MKRDRLLSDEAIEAEKHLDKAFKHRGTPGCENCVALQFYCDNYSDSPLWDCNCDCERCTRTWERNDQMQAIITFISVDNRTRGWVEAVESMKDTPTYYFSMPYGDIVKCNLCAKRFEPPVEKKWYQFWR